MLLSLSFLACDRSRPPVVPAAADVPAAAVVPAAALESSVHVALGIPTDADPSDDVLLDRSEFVVSYNPRLNAPNWVAWHLDASDLGSTPRSSGFRSDAALPPSLYVVRDADYAGSGYDRGHLCPSADRTRSVESNRATFVFTNAHPQLHELNAGPWEKLETRERELARQGKELFLVAGGIFDAAPPRIGKRRRDAERVAVPAFSYKIVVVLEHGQRAADVTADTQVIAAIMPNVRTVAAAGYPLFATSIRAVETATGYDFDPRVEKSVQDTLETRAP